MPVRPRHRTDCPMITIGRGRARLAYPIKRFTRQRAQKSMSFIDFTVPLKPSDLETAKSGWKVVATVAPTAGLADLLSAAAGELRQDVQELARQETFDLAYSALRSFGSLPADAQRSAYELCSDAVQQAAKAAKRALASSAPLM